MTMSNMRNLQIIFCVIVAGVLLMSCSPEAAQDEPMQMPFKENTWVRKETLTKSSDNMFTSTGEQVVPLPIDAKLTKKLNTISTSSSSINSEEECLSQANTLDKRRMVVQKRGGAWHVFERVAEAKIYSDYGMQIDSQLNRLVFSLKHICRGAKGMPLDAWGTNKVEELKKYGKEKMRKVYIDLGNPPADVDIWVAYAERALESRKRNIPYSEIGESILRTENLVNLYEELSLRKVDEASLNTFYSDASTLLDVIKNSLKSDPRVALAIQEDNLLPIDDNGLGNEM